MEIKSRFNTLLISLFITIGVALLLWSCHTIILELLSGNPQILNLLPVLASGLIGFVLIRIVLLLEQFEIKNDNQLIVRNIFGNFKKEIYLRDILNYSIIIKRGKRGTSEELVIFLENDKIKIHSGYIKNYDLFKLRITRGIKNNFEYTNKRNRRADKILGAGFLFVGIMSLRSFFIHLDKTNLSEFLIQFWYVLFLWLAFIIYGIYLMLYKNR